MSVNRLKDIRLAKKRFYDVHSDLLSSRYHNFENNLRAYIDFCESNSIMKEITGPLKRNQKIDVHEWWNAIFKTGGSMVGSKRYVLPTDIDEQASLLYRFVLGINEGTFHFLNFTLNVYGHSRFNDNVYEFNNDILRKLNRTLSYKLDYMEEEMKRELSESKQPKVVDPKKVFVVYGRNIKAQKAIFTFLRSLGLSPLEWSQAVKETGKASPYIGEVLDSAFSSAQAVVVLMTPDDEACLRESFRVSSDPDYETDLTGQPRQNVLFEAGMAMGRSQDRTILVELGNLRPFSDILGRHTIRIDDTPEKRHALAQRLETARCQIDITGSDWLSAGEFDDALED